MALPQQLVDFTSPIVANALKTGARGKTVTTTDYGVIGDAMFKKAQMDLGIANLQGQLGMEAARLQGNLGMQQASLLSGLEMDKSRMNFDMAKHRIDTNLKLLDLKTQLRENEVGFFEGLFGTIAGAAQGAIGGFIAGGPVGAVIGGAAGGVATGVGYATEGRRGGEAAKQMLGTVTQGAGLIKQMSQQQQGQDAWQTWSDRAEVLSRFVNGGPDVSPEQRMQAMQMLDNHMKNGMGVLTNDLKMNPQAAAETMQGVMGVYMGNGGGSAGGRSNDWNMNTMRQAVEAKADSRFDDPTQSRQALKEFIAKSQKNYAMAHAGKEMPDELLDAMIVDAGIDRRKGVMEMTSPNAPKRQQQQSSVAEQPAPRRPNEQITTGDLIETESSSRLPNPRKGRANPSQPPAAYREDRPKEAPGRAWHPPMVAGPGVQMDDGLPPAFAEQQLAKQGAETVKALDKNETTYRGPGGIEMTMQDDKTQRNGRGVKGFGLDKEGFIAKAGRALKELDQNLTPETITKELEQIASKIPSSPLNKQGAQASAPVEEGPKAAPRNWDAEIAQKPKEDQPFFREKDSRKIQAAYGAEGKHLEKEDRERLAGSTAAAAQMNKLRDELKGLHDVKGLDREVLKDYQLWKQGSIGDEGMTGKGAGATAGGFGGSWQSFEKSVRQSLEGKGVKGKAQDDVIQKLKSIDAKVDPLAQSLAVAKQGSRPSDTDVAAYKSNLVNLMDPNPDNSIAGLVSLQDLIYEDFRSFMNLVPSRGKYLQREREEGAAHRMSASDMAARREATLSVEKPKKKSYFEKLRDGEDLNVY